MFDMESFTESLFFKQKAKKVLKCVFWEEKVADVRDLLRLVHACDASWWRGPSEKTH